MEKIIRYHVLVSLAGRTTIVDPAIRSEIVGLVVYRCRGKKAEIWPGYPTTDSPVHYAKFFDRLCKIYEPLGAGTITSFAALAESFGVGR